MIIIIVVFLIFLCVCMKDVLARPALYPPGPPLLPFIGNLPSLWLAKRHLKKRHKVLQLWTSMYGNLLGLKMGLVNLVVVSGREMIKEVYSREVFDGRPDCFVYKMRAFGKKLGIVFSDGRSWHSTRRVVLKYLKSFGYGTRSMEAIIAEECQEMVKLRMDDAGKPVLVNKIFEISIVNILWRIVAGKRYDLTDKRLIKLCDLITRAFKVVDMSGGALNFMPFLRHVAPGFIGYTEMKNIHSALHDFIHETIEEHRNTIDYKNPRDVIDAFLIEMSEKKNGAFTEEELQVVCLDFLEAGIETVSNTAVFIILHIVRNKNVQVKIRKEIDDIIGFHRPPTLSDRSSMVYTEAVLLEGLRISSVAAVGIPHKAMEDARLGKYIIPKGTLILLALFDLHNCSHWKDPEVFRPERFLTKDGNLLQDDWFMPFGLGKRRCIGEGLARSEIFMFITHLLQRFILCMPDGVTLPTTEPLDGVTLSAEPFSILFKPRFRSNSF